METKSFYEFNLNNATADIVRVIPAKDELSYFVDPWGRDSSSIPDKSFKISTFSNETEFNNFIKLNMRANEYDEFVKVIDNIAGRKTD